MLLNAGIVSKVEFREWYFGETRAQALAAIGQVDAEQAAGAEAQLSMLMDGRPNPPEEPEPEPELEDQ